MTEKQQRKGFLGAIDKLIRILDGVKGIALLLGGLSLGGGVGTFAASDTARLEAQDDRIDTLETKVNRMEKQQMDFFSAQVEADTALRAVLERRAEDKVKAATERKAVENLINLGGTP